MELIFNLSSKSLRWFIGLIYCLLFAVLYFPVTKNATNTIVTLNLLIILSTITFIIKKDFAEKLLSPVVLTRAVFAQILVQLSIYIYWGQFNKAAITRLPLVFHQIFFGYLFIFLLSGLSGKKFKISFSPAAAILSTNLFIWFSSELYYVHYALIIIAMTAKTYLTRKVNGEDRHIFNPSGFVSNIAAIAISLMQFGYLQENVYASQMGANFLWVPNFDSFVLLASCVSLWAPNMYLVPIASILTMTIFEVLCHSNYGVSFTSETPRGSIMLGLALLVTDPATAPKSKTGQFLYGIGYAFSIFISFMVIAFFKWQMYFVKVFFFIPFNFLAYRFDQVGVWLEINVFNRLKLDWNTSRKRLLISYLAISIISSASLTYKRGPPYYLDFANHLPSFSNDIYANSGDYSAPSFFQYLSPMHLFHVVKDLANGRVRRPKIPYQSPRQMNSEFDQFEDEYKRR
jgi:hypothetical protein